MNLLEQVVFAQLLNSGKQNQLPLDQLGHDLLRQEV